MDIVESKYINLIIYSIKMFFIIYFTYEIAFKSIENKKDKLYKKIIVTCCFILISILCTAVKYYSNSLNSISCLVICLAIVFAMNTKINLGYSIISILFCLSINYILFFLAGMINFVPNMILKNNNDLISFTFIIFTYIIIEYLFFKIKRFKNGFDFLRKNSKNEYFEILILNLSVIILFLVVILSSYNEIFTSRFGTCFIIFAIIMFITIQKSLQLYYKQKLLIQDLEETKKELENKKEEIKQLEKENLEFSKTSHSIAHKQKSLENKLNELILKNEIASEIDLKERINKISKEIYNKTAEIELTKTEIPEIDDMLKYMQSECSKNDIDFQLQLSGNIHHMINHHIAKEKLEILLADHIKNAIIAINYSDNINKSILVRMGIIDGNYGLYIYDSGIEFEIETLINLGEKPSTTHKESGGTGMGFMNTFDTLKASKASMTIKEYNKPCKDNFTKLIMIKFDDKNEFKICSYRAEEIKNEDIMKKLKIESI